MNDLDVQRLCARLAAAPAAFCAAVEPNQPGNVQVTAVAADLFRDRTGAIIDKKWLAPLGLFGRAGSDARRAARRHLELVLLACWLLYDDAFDGIDAERLAQLLGDRLKAMATVVVAQACVADGDRREELVRVCLASLSLRPAGESRADADDRLAGLDSVRRAKLLRKARDKEAERQRKRLDKLRKQEEEAKRQAARATFED